MERKLTRSRTDRMLGGVLGGLAAYLNIDSVLVRVLYCALSLFTAGFPGLLLYILMLILVPEDRSEQ
ncbi:MAG: PspC domain-containing protein [Bacteroidales bacterium]|jgi:phage shock protein C|nr:PspC domain-containing protein [Bacteroidales bacterium]MDD2617830.1 PspC domain-containing protein [Bacteroidales bacterium]MDD3431123.1 PspC domain-containing protein [Bacteroidales bacterium]MDD4361768.1 PspC domain-containing protein [Bacteroidales bacterium]MDD4430581.1 PspC domain-containing protein [Bacteroidales bacterium]